MEIFDFEIIENTCNNTEKPPNPSKKLQSKMHEVGLFEKNVLVVCRPFVSSIIPVKNPSENS